MNNLAKSTPSPVAADLEKVLVAGDLSRLSAEQRIQYYRSVCESVGVNPLTRPFEYITLNGKLTLYARRDCADQLRNINKVSISITNRQKIDDVYIVTAKAKREDGREDESTGAVNVAGLKGEALANAFMKAETKAKRRVTLSICGLGLLDESEVESVSDSAEPKNVTPQKNPLKEIKEAKRVVDADPGEYEVTFGKFKGQKLKDLDAYEVASYIAYIENSAKDQGKEIKGQVAEFLSHANKFIDSKMESPAALEVDEKLPFEDGYAPGSDQ